MLYYGPVRVPADATTGKAILRIELPETSAFRSIPTELEITIR